MCPASILSKAPTFPYFNILVLPKQNSEIPSSLCHFKHFTVHSNSRSNQISYLKAPHCKCLSHEPFK